MRIRSLGTLALIAVAATANAQTKQVAPPKVAPCDSSAILLGAAPIFNVGTKSIVAACPAFADRIATYYAAHPALTASELVSELLHGKIPTPPAPPTDTAIITPPPVVVPPKDSTPIVTPPKDTATPPVVAPAGSLVNAHPMGALTQPFVVVPKGWAGRSAPDLKVGGGTGTVTGEGAVRILTNLATMAFDDPIVYPGQPGVSHLHQFFGNSRISAFSNGDSLRANCSSTNSGGTLNCTTYWTPAMIDASGQVVAPVDWPDKNGGATIYYKDGYMMPASVITPAPNGLKMIAGDKTWSNTKQNQEHAWWTCADGPGPAFSSTIPDCVGRVELIVIFPQCWDGVNLDSPDHKSHMSYPTYSNNANGSKCPAKYPVAIPEITELFYWRVPAGVKSSTWHISSDLDITKPGGLSAHADWLMGWDPATMKNLVAQCLNPSKDSGTNGLCDNTYLNPPP